MEKLINDALISAEAEGLLKVRVFFNTVARPITDELKDEVTTRFAARGYKLISLFPGRDESDTDGCAIAIRA